MLSLGFQGQVQDGRFLCHKIVTFQPIDGYLKRQLFFIIKYDEIILSLFVLGNVIYLIMLDSFGHFKN